MSSVFRVSSAAICLLPLLLGCPASRNSNQIVVITGEIQRDAFIYKVPNPNEPDPDSFIPLQKLQVGKSVELPPGNYFVATECSGFSFKHGKDSPTKIVMSKVLLSRQPSPENPDDPEEPLLLECTDPVDGQYSRWTDRTQFAVFPGSTSFSLTKKLFSVTSSTNESQVHILPLAPVMVSGGPNSPKDKYFVLPEQKASPADSFVISAPAGKRVWVPPGTFVIEINGTRRKVTVEKDIENEILAGTLRIEMPSAFSPASRANAGGQPVFAYIDDGVLFNLNTDYLLMPGEYTLNIEGSEIKRTVMIEPHKSSLLQTRVAQIDAPPCPTGMTCRTPQKITVHREKRPFSMLYVNPGVPFLVFDDVYEYGVDGTRGVFRSLPLGTTTLRKEKLARLKIEWEILPASGKVRTDLVRVEAKGDPNFGRSLDLLFSKPDEIYLPPGNYALTYFVGDPSNERPKTRIDLHLAEGETHKTTVPLYVDHSAKAKFDLEDQVQKPKTTGQEETPSVLTPIQR
jgi:hypothetical protein